MSTESDQAQSLRVETGPVLAIGRPSRLFQTKLLPLFGQPQYAVTADGQRFLGIEHTQKASRSFTFLVNWLNGFAPNTGSGLR
jgi:hypothetical protein